MQYCMDHSDETNKLARVKAQVMMEHIEKVLDRAVKCDLLADRNGNLSSEPQVFRVQGTRMRTKMWFQNMKIKLIVLIAIIVALILIIVLSVSAGGVSSVVKSLVHPRSTMYDGEQGQSPTYSIV